MGRRQRQRHRAGGADPAMPVLEPGSYADAEGNVLVLRASLSPASRLRYAEVLAGSPLSREDAWHRAVEFLFEHLAVSWEIAGLRIERERELLERLRAASPAERAWVRSVMREHCAEHFPELEAP
jgi:hypothetical protein